MFNPNRDRVLSIGIESLGYNPKSNHRIEKRVDALEQRMSKAEVAVEQLRQMVLEQQSRPPVTVEQIRELIREERNRRNRRRRRPRGRVQYYHEEEEWSNNNSWSWDSPQPPQIDGGNDRFYDVKEETHLNKSEYQPETAVKASETAVKVTAEHMRVCVTENHTTVTDKKPGSLAKVFPKPKSLDPPSPESNPSELWDSDRPTTTLVRRVPPPKPPVGDLLAMAGKFQIIQAPVAHTQLLKPESSDSNQSVMILPRRVPLPKPPDPENYGDGKGLFSKLPPQSESLATDSRAGLEPLKQAQDKVNLLINPSSQKIQVTHRLLLLTSGFAQQGVCGKVFENEEKRLCAGMTWCLTFLTHLLSSNGDFSVLQGGGKLHGNSYYAERMCEYTVMLTIHFDDNLFIILVLNGRYMKEEPVSVPLSFHTMNCHMENIESDFLVLLDKLIAYVFVLLLGIIGVTTFDPLDASREVLIFPADPMIDHVRATVDLKERNCRLSLRGSASEVVLQIRLLEADSTSSQQWDPGDQVWFSISTTILQGEYLWNTAIMLRRFLSFRRLRWTGALFFDVCIGATTIVHLKIFMFSLSYELQFVQSKTKLATRESKMISDAIESTRRDIVDCSLQCCDGKEPIFGSEHRIDQWPSCIAYALVHCYISRISKHENYKFSKIIGVLGDMLITTFEFQEWVNFCNQSSLQKFMKISSSILKSSMNNAQVMVLKEVPRSLASIIIWKDKFVLKFLDFLLAVQAMFVKSTTSDKFMATFLMFTWNLGACYLERLCHLANEKMVELNSSVRIIPWDPGKSMLLWLKLFVNVIGNILFQYMLCLIRHIADSQSLPEGLPEIWRLDK
ncbi:unnamed protein product [Trifolium pratense]|uniref:Uncharacterized protein n=1 Tax=Trifolium pratense TaxID=57577 RepID=A0ACB0IM60_TRIPR|nr:unnamed protein product [Trifolium pratense]